MRKTEILLIFSFTQNLPKVNREGEKKSGLLKVTQTFPRGAVIIYFFKCYHFNLKNKSQSYFLMEAGGFCSASLNTRVAVFHLPLECFNLCEISLCETSNCSLMPALMGRMKDAQINSYTCIWSNTPTHGLCKMVTTLFLQLKSKYIYTHIKHPDISWWPKTTTELIYSYWQPGESSECNSKSFCFFLNTISISGRNTSIFYRKRNIMCIIWSSFAEFLKQNKEFKVFKPSFFYTLICIY